MPPRIVLGQSDFVSLRDEGALYVDKSGFVAEILNAPAQVLLYPRPRRFGKTLNLSMAAAFLERGPDRTALFSDLEIWRNQDARAHFQRYPVIRLTFKDLKQRSWAEARAAIEILLAAEVARHAAALDDPRLDPGVKRRLLDIRDGAGELTRALLDLSEALSLHHGEKVVLLIDEYDAGVLTAWEHGYYDEAVAFFRTLLSPGLKDNPHLFRGVLTGILRVARESMFSGLNNIRVFSLLHPRTGEFFGFTDGEVSALLEAHERREAVEEVRRWYNGYHFGEATVYNPWSILCFLSEPGALPAPYWLNTSENGLVRALLLDSIDLHADVLTLIAGGSVETRVEESVPLRDLHGASVWSLFLFGGYLTAERVTQVRGRVRAGLRIPNFEVQTLWEDTFLEWMERMAGALDPLHAAILGGDARQTEEILGRMLLRHVSVNDVARDQDEVFYHAFVLGLLVSLEGTHLVRSNREVGRGRADVQIIPRSPGRSGVVLEFKRRQAGKDLETSAEEALGQIQDRAYTAELVAAGASPIRTMGIAFSGKDVVVRASGVDQEPPKGPIVHR